MTYRDSGGLLNRDVTSLIKGMAILLMICNHLFGAYVVNIDVNDIESGDALFALFHSKAWAGKTCIALFAFVTGYGYYMSAKRERNWGATAGWNRVRKFYPLFCLICLVNVALVSAFPPPDLTILMPWWQRLTTMVGYRQYIADYWYIAVVLMTAFAFYPLLLWASRRGFLTHTCVFACLCFLNFFVDLGWVPWISETLYPEAWCWTPYFLVGWALGSVRVTEGCKSLTLRNLTLPSIWLGLLFLRFLASSWMGIPHYSLKVPFLRYALVCVILACVIHRLPRYLWSWLAALGTYSAVMWLNHRMIFGYWFADFFYGLPTPLNYLLLVVLSFALSYPVTKGWNRLLRWWEQRRVACAGER